MKRLRNLRLLRHSLLSLPRPAKRAIQVFLDVVLLFAAAWAAYALRLGFAYMPSTMQFLAMALAPLVAVPIFVRMGLYRAVLRYLPDRAFWTVVQAMSLATIVWVSIVFLAEWYGGEGVPRSIPILYWLVGIALVGGLRFAARQILRPPVIGSLQKPVLIYGAGRAGTQLASALHADNQAKVVGFVDDSRRLQGQNVAGIKVYSAEQLPVLIERLGVKDIILCMPSASAARRLQIGASLSKLRVNLRSMPSITELAAGKYSVSNLKTIQIEDLLGRSRVPANGQLLSTVIADKTVLVSGAGGSIGSELCRKISQQGPKKLLLLDASEVALYDISREIGRDFPEVEISERLLSVTDRQGIEKLFQTESVDTVFHAGAYKHVPMLEKNVRAAIVNNVLGTHNLAHRAFEAGAATFVLISTDKAVRPASVMGATKRWSELIVRGLADLAEQRGTGQRFLTVRFGNVLGSNGSVVPLFREQIARGGPVTITDDRMTRYFMAIPEAAELILQSAALSTGGEIFLLDMGEPVLIRTLAKNIVHMAGLTVKSHDNPDGDIEIVTVGARPGEKLHEELFYDPSLSEQTDHPKIFRAKRRNLLRQPVERAVAELRAMIENNEENKARDLLFDLVSERTSAPSDGAEKPLSTSFPAAQ